MEIYGNFIIVVLISLVKIILILKYFINIDLSVILYTYLLLYQSLHILIYCPLVSV